MVQARSIVLGTIITLAVLLIHHVRQFAVNSETGICRDHGWRPYEGTRKVYDLVMVSTELDWLEIRLRELYNVVDYFIIVESATTFTGLSKPLFLLSQMDKFDRFKDKLVYHILEPSMEELHTNWQREDFQRDAMYHQVLLNLNPEPGDVIMVSDVDEIPRPESVDVLRQCDFPRRLTLESMFYYYSFQWRHRGNWMHPQATYYTGASTITPSNLRNGEGSNFVSTFFAHYEKATLRNASWHCSSCFSTMAEVRNKLSSFSHSGWNRDEFRTTESLIDKFRHGLDLFERPEEVYDRVERNFDVPNYVLQNRDSFRYLLDRDGEDASFNDLPLEAPAHTEFLYT